MSVIGWKKNLSNCKRMPHLLLLALSSVTEVKNTAKVTKCLPRCLPPPPHAAGGVACVLPKPTTWPAARRGAAQALAPARCTIVAYSRKPLLSVEYRSDRVAWRCDVRDSLLGVEHWAYGVKRVRFFCLLINFVCLFATEVTQCYILPGSIWGNLANPLFYILLTSRPALSSQNAFLIQLQLFDQVKHGNDLPLSSAQKLNFMTFGQSMTEAVFLTLGRSQSSHFKKLGLRPKT